MKKLVLAAAVVAVLGVGSYVYQQSKVAKTGAILAQVPSDTLFLSYQTEAIDLGDFVASTSGSQPTSTREMFADEDLSRGASFMLDLFDSYLQASTNPQELKDFLGLGDTINPVFYTLGAVPVLKLPVENPAAVWDTLDKQERKSGFKHKLVKEGAIEYRRYEINNVGDSLGFVIAVIDNVLTVTFDVTPFGQDNPLKLALGLEKPASSMMDVDRLTKLETRYGKENTAFSFIDFRQVATGLTTRDGNLLARQMKVFENDADYGQLHISSCNTELTQIANNWPQLVGFGRYEHNSDELNVKGSFVFESNNQVIIDALKSIRGALNSTGETPSIFGLSLGLDVTALAPAVSTIWTELTSTQYQCPILADAQLSMQQNPAPMIGMGAGMLNGLKGVSFQLFDIDMAASGMNGSEVKQIDAMISVSADNPEALLQTAKMFTPELSNIQIQADSKPVNIGPLFTQYTGMPMDLYARLNGSHLALYSGELAKNASDSVMIKPLSADGLMSFSMDGQRLLEFSNKAAELTGEVLPSDLTSTLEGDVVGEMKMDVIDHGIAFDFNYKFTNLSH